MLYLKRPRTSHVCQMTWASEKIEIIVSRWTLDNHLKIISSLFAGCTPIQVYCFKESTMKIVVTALIISTHANFGPQNTPPRNPKHTCSGRALRMVRMVASMRRRPEQDVSISLNTRQRRYYPWNISRDDDVSRKGSALVTKVRLLHELNMLPIFWFGIKDRYQDITDQETSDPWYQWKNPRPSQLVANSNRDSRPNKSLCAGS